MKETTEVRAIRFKVKTIKNATKIAAAEGRTFAAQIRVMVEKRIKKGA